MPGRRCEACDTELFWAKTQAGKWIPLDRASRRKVTIVDKYFGDGTPLAEIFDGYTVHFETCPDADRFPEELERHDAGDSDGTRGPMSRRGIDAVFDRVDADRSSHGCPHCPVRFDSGRDVAGHIEVFHPDRVDEGKGEAMFKCSAAGCGREFELEHGLEVHHRRSHGPNAVRGSGGGGLAQKATGSTEGAGRD